MIEVKPLRYFLAAYEEGSITAAASRCFIAQPSITHAIKSLEASLEVTLFERSKQGIKPTRDGNKLYKLASDFLLQNQHLEETFNIKLRSRFTTKSSKIYLFSSSKSSVGMVSHKLSI